MPAFPERNTYMRAKRFIAAVLCAALGMSLCGCKKTPTLNEPDTPPVLTAHKTVNRGSGGALEITRRDIGDTPMGEDGTWTVFVYISGTDLEEKYGYASRDINEMLAASTGENVRFIVQTGGSKRWHNDNINAEYLERWEISGGKLTKLAQLPSASMANGSTLRNFLKWGIENHSAAKMGVIFWGHGKGTIGGLCKDDLFGSEFLSLESMNAAFSETAELMTDKFEFIGFDNCYMATAETADIAASYANYMIASEDLEPANGWNYTVIGDLLGKDPNADWNTIAQTFCDGFMKDNSGSKRADLVTLSVIDLSKLDDIFVKFDEYSNDLCVSLDDTARRLEFEAALGDAEHYGDENGFAGYGNIADIGDLAAAGGRFSDKTNALLSAIDDAVICKRAGKNHENASGLTVYYPFEPRGLSEIASFARLSVSPRYLAFIDQMLRGTALAPDTKSSGKAAIDELWLGDVNNGTRRLDEYWGCAPSSERNKDSTEKSTAVKLVGKPMFKNGEYELALEPSSLRFTKQMGLNVYYSEKSNKFQALGTRLCPAADIAAGKFSDRFDGCWFMLNDGSPLQIKRRGDGKFVAQVMFGGTETTMLFTAEGSSAAIDGIRKPAENGLLSFEAADIGDVIAPLRDICTGKGNKFRTESGAEYTITSEPNIIYDTLADGDYLMMLTVDDIWGGRYETDIVKFSVADGRLVFPPTEQ